MTYFILDGWWIYKPKNYRPPMFFDGTFSTERYHQNMIRETLGGAAFMSVIYTDGKCVKTSTACKKYLEKYSLGSECPFSK